MTSPHDSAARALPRGPWHTAVYLTHPQVPSWAFTAAHAERLQRALPRIRCRLCSDRAAFRAALPEAHLALVWAFHQADFDLAPNLCVVATPSAGRDYFRVTPPAGVGMLYGRFHGRIMAETAVGMILGMCRGLLPAATTFADDPWPRQPLGALMRPLRGAHVVILGMGHIGSAIATLVKAFGARVTGLRRSPRPDERPDGFGPADRVLPVSALDAVLPETDHLVMVLPADAGTAGILDARRLALLPPHATLCNLGRGQAVDEDALVEALRQGRLAGACLDVFREEPLPAASPLRHCPNLWRLPHASAISPDYLDLFVDDLAAQLRRWPGGTA
ncbi:MAG: hydroxyacid dehydrogenase [Lentisphaerae bacterium]|nr:hydroxyacid dehydrogenase [Lentisphaerota bacterium]